MRNHAGIFNDCLQKEGPVVRDSVKPHSTLQISGGGFSKTFDSDSDYTYGQLNLKPNTKYNFRKH